MGSVECSPGRSDRPRQSESRPDREEATGTRRSFHDENTEDSSGRQGFEAGEVAGVTGGGGALEPGMRLVREVGHPIRAGERGGQAGRCSEVAL